MFEFMSHLLCQPNQGLVMQLHENFFFPVSTASIDRAQETWKCQFPSQLVQFFQELGWGQLQSGRNGDVADFNFVASPDEMSNIFTGTSDWLMPYSELEPDTLPFFQRDVDLFLCLKPKSDNPNAVWWMWGEQMPNGGKICDSLVEFFQRLVEDPNWFNPPKIAKQ
jgi:SMI1 / KNR4 family (SUKH-1)